MPKTPNTLKYLTTSITHQTQTPLSKIKSTCHTIRDNLDQAILLVDSIFDAAARSLLTMDIALQNVQLKQEIDKTKFTNLSIANVTDNAIAKYLFTGEKEMALLNVDLANDFVFKGDEILMSFVILNLLKNALSRKAKINIWLDAQKRGIYFKCNKVEIFADEADISWQFCRRVMKAFDGNISIKFLARGGKEFCLLEF
jgi:K+-sensing histidine kinase KdpD